MSAPLRTYDRLTVRVSGSGATFRFEPAWLRFATPALVLAALAFLVFIAVAPEHWPNSFFTTPFVVFTVVVGPHRRQQLITDGIAANTAFRAAAAYGREVRPGKWRIDGTAAKPLAEQLSHIQYGERTALAQLNASLDTAEPNHVPADGFQPGDPWPNLPRQPEPWPLLQDGGAPHSERSSGPA